MQEEIKKHIDFFERLKSGLSFYGIVYVIVLTVIIYSGVMYISNINYINQSKFTKLEPVNDSLKEASGDLPVKKGSITPPVDVMKFKAPGQDIIAHGGDLFKTTCATCHGETGEGNGPAGANLNPKPRNFHEQTGWKNGPTIDMMYKTLQEGIPNSGMASYASLPPEDRFALIWYVRGFSNFPPVTDEQLKKIDDTYSLLKGVKEPNQIPVKMAMDLLIKEYDSTQAKINKVIQLIQSNNTDTAAVIFKSISSNIDKSVTALAVNMNWNVNEDEFVKFIITNSNQKGFKGEAADLSREEAAKLYAYLKGLFA